MSLTFISLLLLLVFSCTSATQSTQEDYFIQTQLSNALMNSPYALFTLKELFYPDTPVCNPVRFELTCNDTDFTYNKTYLWTSYDANSYVGQILLSSAYYGILVKGFDWESSCNTESQYLVVLNLLLPSCENLTAETDALDKQLLAFTVTLKAYVSDNTAVPKGSSLSDNKGYAIEDWKERDKDNKIFNTSYVILSMLVACLDFFIFVFSIAICSAVYDAIYHEIKGKKNPYYPIYMATILCTMMWNVGPGWLVLLFDTNHIKWSFIVLIPLQLVLAVIMKKYPDFPLPGLPCTKKTYINLEDDTDKDEKTGKDHDTKSQSYFLWEIGHMKSKGAIIASFLIQSICLWSLLVFFTYVAYYSVGVTISLYLYPIQTLVKVIFVKAVAVCIVFDVAILFSGKTWDFKCTTKGVISDIAMVFASISLLPIIAFVAFVAGGVIFTSSSSQLSGLQGILVLLPSMILLLVGWYSKGTLFPEKLVPDSSSQQDLSDVEAVAVKKGATPTVDSCTVPLT